jgi:cyclophilin family peptidyl-prolyl cis-trans isomerase
MSRFLIIGALAAAALAPYGAPANGAEPIAATAKPATAKPGPTGIRRPVGAPEIAVLETTQGTIAIKFYSQDAPKTVANFKKLVRSKFYDGTYFHRVIPQFMIQGGDPNTKNADPNDDGMGGPGYTVPAEIKRQHLRGSVATARLGDAANPKKESSGSQFFIDVAPQPSLDSGGYTVFGEVISGMDAVDKIVAMGADPSTPRGPGGPNPGKSALIKRAWLEPQSKWVKPVAAEATPSAK